MRSPRSERSELGREEDGRPEYELRSAESRPLAVRPPDVAPSRYEPELGREVDDPPRDEEGREELSRDGRPDALDPRDGELLPREPDDGRPEDGREERDPEEELRSLGRPCERDDELSAGMAAPIFKTWVK